MSSRRITSFIGLLFLSLFLVFFAFTKSASADSECTKYTVPVTLSATDPTLYNVVGFLCSQGNLTGQTVQVLVSGGQYGHVYWDFPFESDTYSYVQSAIQNGYATFNLDRIGIGESDHPDPSLITVQSNAFVVHQIIQGLRNGSFGGGVHFPKVIIVGHSIGSGITIVEATTYQDVDGVIITGFIHTANNFGAAIATNNSYSAFLDPRFPTLPFGYFTSKPGTRLQSFYYAPTADPNVVAVDEETKETVTLRELQTYFPLKSSTVSTQIHVPVLVALGEFDNFSCGTGSAVDCSSLDSLQSYESNWYSPDASLQTFILNNAGHDINLQTNAPEWYSAAVQWANRFVGSGQNQQ